MGMGCHNKTNQLGFRKTQQIVGYLWIITILLYELVSLILSINTGCYTTNRQLEVDGSMLSGVGIDG